MERDQWVDGDTRQYSSRLKGFGIRGFVLEFNMMVRVIYIFKSISISGKAVSDIRTKQAYIYDRMKENLYCGIWFLSSIRVVS